MERWRSDSTDTLCEAILSLKTREECYAFLADVCTVREIQDLSQRLAVARLLHEKVSYNAISRATGASTATISRVSKCCEYGAGGYGTVIARLAGEEGK